MKPGFGAIVVAVVLACSGWSQDQHRPLLLLVEPAKDYPTYHLDNADVSTDPLRGLGLAMEKTGGDWPLTIAVDSRLPINALWNAGALAGKAGFVNIHYYAFHHEDRKGVEVSFGKHQIPSPLHSSTLIGLRHLTVLSWRNTNLSMSVIAC